MSITLTANYTEVLKSETVEFIQGLLEDNYALDDILEFVDNHSEDDLVSYYEEYVRCGEAIGYDAVDALINEQGVDYIDGCDERFMGWYQSEADFAEEFYSDQYDVPVALVVDWQATYDSSLRYDFTSCDVKYAQVAIFRDY